MKPAKIFSELSPTALLAAVLAAAFVLAAALLAIRPLENLSRDLMVSALSPFTAQASTKDIVLVTVTEDTLTKFPYRSPIDRGFLAALVEKIDAANPRAIGIDILFDQATEPAKDAALANALANAKAPVVIAAADEFDGLTPDRRRTFLPSRRRRGAVWRRSKRIRATASCGRRFAGRPSGQAWQPGFPPALAAAAGRAEDRSERHVDGILSRPGRLRPAPIAAFPGACRRACCRLHGLPASSC